MSDLTSLGGAVSPGLATRCWRDGSFIILPPRPPPPLSTRAPRSMDSSPILCGLLQRSVSSPANRLAWFPPWGTADAEIQVLSTENQSCQRFSVSIFRLLPGVVLFRPDTGGFLAKAHRTKAFLTTFSVSFCQVSFDLSYTRYRYLADWAFKVNRCCESNQ